MKETRNKKRKMHPFLKGFLGCILVMGVIAAGISFVTASAFHGKLNYEKIETANKEPFKEDGVKNILLIGNGQEKCILKKVISL